MQHGGRISVSVIRPLRAVTETRDSELEHGHGPKISALRTLWVGKKQLRLRRLYHRVLSKNLALRL